MTRRRIALALPFVAGATLVVVGLVLWLRSGVSVGWFAYAPLSDQTFVPPGMIFGGVAFVFVIVGIATLAGWSGYLLGRRRI